MFQSLYRNPVMAAFLSCQVGRTHIIIIFFSADPRFFSRHRHAAVRTDRNAGKQVNFVLRRRCPHIQTEKFLHDLKITVRYQRFMVLFNADPLSLAPQHLTFYLVIRRCTPALHKIPDIKFILQDPPDCHGGPFCLPVRGESGPVPFPLLSLVF